MSIWTDLGRVLFGIGKGIADERKARKDVEDEAAEARDDAKLKIDLRKRRHEMEGR